jgi:hypothetical protein
VDDLQENHIKPVTLENLLSEFQTRCLLNTRQTYCHGARSVLNVSVVVTDAYCIINEYKFSQLHSRDELAMDWVTGFQS